MSTKSTEFNPLPGEIFCDIEITRSTKGVIRIASAGHSISINVREARLLFKWLEHALPDALPLVR